MSKNKKKMLPGSIYNRIIGLLLIGLMAAPAGLSAQDATMADLKAVVARLKALTTYSYVSTSNAAFPNGQKDRTETHVYMDATHKRLSYTTGTQVLLLTDKWAYKADHRQKAVSVFNVVKYNDKYKKALPELETVFRTNLAGVFLDSVLVRSGKLVSARKQGNKTTFTVTFPQGYNVEEMVVVYDYGKQLPESIRTRAFYPGDASGRRTKGTTVETVSDRYSASIPESVFDTRQYFSIQKGKVVLSRYPQYKISSVL